MSDGTTHTTTTTAAAAGPAAGLASTGIMSAAEAVAAGRPGQAAGAAAGAGQAATAADHPAAASTPARRTSTRAKRTGSNGKQAAATVGPDGQHTVNITLPHATYLWFEQQAAAAEYEPTLAKYLQWQLREVEKKQRAAADTAAALARATASEV